MNKLLILGVLGTAFCLVAPPFAQSAEILYGNADGFYALGTADGNQSYEGAEIETRLCRPWKVRVELAGLLADPFSLESESTDEYPQEVPRRRFASVDLNVDGDATTSMRVVKFRGNAETVKPFLVLGGGHLDAEVDDRKNAGRVLASGSDSPKDTGAKVGFGIDVCASDDMLVGLEGSHVWALDDSDDPGSFTFTLGIAYHF